MPVEEKVTKSITSAVDESTEPWKPALILKCEDVPGKRLKWVRQDLIERFKAEGWIISNSITKTAGTIIDGSPLTSTVQKRELVLMEISEARAKARDKYYKSLTDGALGGSVQEFKDVAQEGTGKSYGDVKIIQGGA